MQISKRVDPISRKCFNYSTHDAAAMYNEITKNLQVLNILMQRNTLFST
jgi:hypothetical protein